ncbi:MAG: multiheme c-type cytochrome [bacterium]
MHATEMNRSEFRSLCSQIGRIVLTAVVFVLPLVLIMSTSYAASGPDGELSPLPGHLTQEYNYVGVDGCKMCHRSPAKGNQFGQWEGTLHAKAYETLASDYSREVAQEAGVSGDPQQAEACLECHVTAAGLPDSRKEGTYKKEEGVGCESCHGPGSAYKSITIMRDHEKALANGLIVPDEETCVKCHNEKSPTFKGFDYEEALPLVSHPYPGN